MVCDGTTACVAHCVNVVGEAHRLTARIVGEGDVARAKLVFKEFRFDVHGTVHGEGGLIKVRVANDLAANVASATGSGGWSGSSHSSGAAASEPLENDSKNA